MTTCKVSDHAADTGAKTRRYEDKKGVQITQWEASVVRELTLMNASTHLTRNTGIASLAIDVMNHSSSSVPSALSSLAVAFANSSSMSLSATQIHRATMERTVEDYPDVHVYNDTESDYLYSSYSSYAYNNSHTISAQYNKIMTVLYIALPILVAVVGIIGNSTVIYIIVKHRDMQTVTNYFLANLAATDVVILTLCAIPSAVASLTEVLPVSVCKGVNYVMFVSLSSFLLIIILFYDSITINFC